MIQMVHVSKIYPSQISALSDVSLEVSEGEFAFINGPSGSGKTTLLRILFGAERPTRGEVIINGVNITQSCSKIYELRRTMGIVFQDSKLLQDRSVSENVALTLEVTGQFLKEDRSKVLDILEQVGLRDRERESILSLSAGEQQRVAIARALVNHPPLLLVDEPTGNLDAESTDDVMQVFNHFYLKGTTLVFATHDKELVRHYPHRIIHLLAGQTVDLERAEAISTEA
jgi:cell division transport system ATP-binding protein